MNKIVWAKIKNKRYYNTLIKLNEIGITLYETKKDKDYLLIKTSLKDYKRIKKYLVSYEVEIYDVSGFLKVKELVKKYLVFILSSILSIGILMIANLMVFKIDIKSNKESISELLLEELKKYGLKVGTLKHNHKDIEVIVQNILEDNKDILEWLEIKYDGLIMVVNVTEKTIFNNEEEKDECDIVSKKDAKILSMNLYRGVALKEVNDYVLKGETLISGAITHNEEVKNTTCASGEVYGEVWYKAKVEVPFLENYIEYTNKNRYNLSININDKEYAIFKSRLEHKKISKTVLYKLNDFQINFLKEKEYKESTKVLTQNEAMNKGINLAIEKVNLRLGENEEILTKKVLKKEVNDSTIYLEIFIVTKENIGIVKEGIGGLNNDEIASWKNSE